MSLAWGDGWQINSQSRRDLKVERVVVGSSRDIQERINVLSPPLPERLEMKEERPRTRCWCPPIVLVDGMSDDLHHDRMKAAHVGLDCFRSDVYSPTVFIAGKVEAGDPGASSKG